jgi:hypothetical protein
MWKPLIEIACALLFSGGVAYVLYLRIRYVFWELDIPSREFRNSSRMKKILWAGFAAILALIGLERP